MVSSIKFNILKDLGMLGVFEGLKPLYQVEVDTIRMDWDLFMSGIPTKENLERFVVRFSSGGKFKFKSAKVIETKTGSVIQEIDCEKIVNKL